MAVRLSQEFQNYLKEVQGHEMSEAEESRTERTVRALNQEEESMTATL